MPPARGATNKILCVIRDLKAFQYMPPEADA